MKANNVYRSYDLYFFYINVTKIPTKKEKHEYTSGEGRFKYLQAITSDSKHFLMEYLTITQVYPNRQAAFRGFLVFGVHILGGFP